MVKASQEWLEGAVKLISHLPPAERRIQPVERQTCVCGKQVPITDLTSLNTGVFLTLNDVCKGCKDGADYDHHHARLVCVKCKRVLMRVPPATDKTGFRFEANKTYHLTGCPQCDPLDGKKEQSYTIIEKAMWNRTHGIKRQEKRKIE